MATIGSLRTKQMQAIMRTQRISQLTVTATFVATLLLPMAAAIKLGIVFALLMQLNHETLDLQIVELNPTETNSFAEKPTPAQLKSNQIILLDIYKSLYYANTHTLQTHLPDPTNSVHPTIIVHLHKHALLKTTSYTMLSDYATQLATINSRLYLTKLDPEILTQTQQNQTIENTNDVHLYKTTDMIEEASLETYRHTQE